MDIICFGQQNWNVTWTGKQHLTSRLALRGHRVLYVDPDPEGEPVTGAGFVRAVSSGTLPALAQHRPGSLWVLAPKRLAGLGWRADQAARDLQIRLALRRLGFVAPTALVIHPDALPRLQALRTLGTVYLAVDDYAEYGGMPEADRRAVRERETYLLATADTVFGVSTRLLERWRDRRPDARLLENGSDTEHFAPTRCERAPSLPAVAALDGPVLGFFGQIDERLDQDLLIYLARANPSWRIVLAGRVKKGVDIGPLEAEPNIHLVGFVAYDALPSFARDVDVWLVPYRLVELARSCNPLKVFEYLATGKPVVATPLDGIIAARDVVRLAGDRESFRRAVEAALADPGSGRAERLAVAAENSWDRRVEVLERALLDAQEAGGRGRSAASRLVRRARRAPRLMPHFSLVDEYGQRREPLRMDTARRALVYGLRTLGMIRWTGVSAARLLLGRPHPRVRRILVVRNAYLGDLVTLLPTLAALRRAYPAARITLGVQPDFASGAILEGTGLVDEITRLKFAWAESRWEELAGALRLFARGFDLVVTGSRIFHREEALFAGAPKHIGLYDGSPFQALIGRVVPRELGRHEADNNLRLIEALTGAVPDEARRPVIAPPSEKVEASWRSLEERLGLPPQAQILVVHPGAKKPTRRWPAERFGAVAAELLADRPGLHVVVTGTAGERPLADAVAAAVPAPLRARVRVAAGDSDLFGLIGLLRRAHALLSNDTGVMHVARALDTPLVAVVGPENDRLWGPYPLGAAPATVVRSEVPCAPCTRVSCAAHFCMRSLRTAPVRAAVADLLEQGRDGNISVERRISSLSWTALVEAGFEVPLVSAILHVDGQGAPALVDEAVDALSRQTYPAIELVVAYGDGAAAWVDRRDARRRSALPVKVVDAAGLAVAVAGSLVVDARGAAGWGRWRLAMDVAGSMRDPNVAGHIDGRPLPYTAREAGMTTRWKQEASKNSPAEPVPVNAVADPGGSMLGAI